MARSARSKGLKDPAYLKWLHRFACIVCLIQELREKWPGDPGSSQITPTEAAHCGNRGLSQKCSDREALPICCQHHRLGRDSAHKLQKNFWEHHGLDRDALIRKYNARYDEEQAA